MDKPLSYYKITGVGLGPRVGKWRYRTMVELKSMARERGLKVSGLKKNLVKRLARAAKKERFPFLDLPAEIRNEVYYWSAIMLESPSMPDLFYGEEFELARQRIKNKDVILQPIITRLCHQTRSEGLPIFYQNRRFIFQDEYDPYVHIRAAHWLNRINPSFLCDVRHIDFFHQNGDQHKGLAYFMDRVRPAIRNGATVKAHFSRMKPSGLLYLCDLFKYSLFIDGPKRAFIDAGDGWTQVYDEICKFPGLDMFSAVAKGLVSITVEFSPR